jgi:hypothetical protein
VSEKWLPARSSLLHPAIAIFMPFFLLQGLDALVRVGIFGPVFPAPPPGFLAVVLLVGLSRTVVSNILRRERAGGLAARFREAVLAFAAALAILTLLSGRPLRGQWNPLQPDVIWPMLLVVIQWLMTLQAHEALRAREMFLVVVEGKTGHALAAAAHGASGQAGESVQEVERLKRTAVVGMVVTVLPYLVYSGIAAHFAVAVPVAASARVLLEALAGIVTMVVANGFIDEQLCAARGIPRAVSAGSLRYAAPLAGVGMLLLCSLALSGRASLLPMSLLARLLAFLQRFRLRFAFTALPPEAPPAQGPTGGMEEMLRELGARAPSPIVQEIVRILGIVAAVALAGAFAYFIVRPLLSRGALQAARRLHPLRLLARRAAAFRAFLLRLPQALSQWLRGPGRGLRDIPRSILATLRESARKAGRESARSARRDDRAQRAALARIRAARSRAVREFLRLARWGEKRGVAFTGAEGPREYAGRLAGGAPDVATSLIRAAELFEEIVYSPAPRARGERDLARIVGGIVQ